MIDTTTERELVPDEVVHIRVDYARIVRHGEDGYVYFDYTADNVVLRGKVRADAASVVITPVLPAAGKPKIGQVWTNARGRRWFACGNPDEATLIDEQGRTYSVTAAHCEDGPIWPLVLPGAA